MEVNGREPDNAATDGFRQALGPSDLDQDKNNVFWMGGVMDCFSTVFSLFGRPDLKPAKEDDWEVPFEAITELVYLGSGAQGVVFGGNLRGEMVAVKKLRDKSESDIKHLRKLNHENIVRFRGISTSPPCYCVIMEYCQYGPLFEFLHSGACFAPKQILKWAKEIAQGMAYLHQYKIIHRDLKSPNILIADNLVVKVSDFGTSREWNDVSAIMSFTGTVAWMAPEVIRHEPCSERVDVWSYGVVLWELLTQEVPYKNLETHAIMWGVGTDTISLPVPTTCPDSLQMLLNQCWHRTPRNRPPFKIIAANLEIAGEDLKSMKPENFSATQASWRKEVQEGMQNFYVRSEAEPASEQSASKRDELKQARDARQLYEQQISRANELYMEVCTVRLQLEQREYDLKEREKALKACRCGVRRGLRVYQRQTSSSSEHRALEQRRRKKKQEPQQMIVNYVEAQSDIHTVTVPMEACACDEAQNNNDEAPVKDTVVESNGNIGVSEMCDVANSAAHEANRYLVPDVAQV